MAHNPNVGATSRATHFAFALGAPFLAAACWLMSAELAAAQDRSVPSAAYHAAFTDFYAGEYKDALDRFRAEGRGSIKTTQSRWIDSICYETMVGECYYQMGHLNQALEHYTAAVQLYVAFSDWMVRVNFPPSLRPSSVGVRIPWGASKRRARLGHYPSSMLISQGRINNNDVVQKGGILQQAILYPINVQEIVRCTTLAIRRRTELLGPVSQYDTLTARLLAALSARPGLPNHWSEAWIDVQLGLAMVAAGKEGQAVPVLQRGLVAAGEYDHPLTSVALLELGRLAMIRADYPTALKYLEEATYSATYYPDYGVLEEAFRYGSVAHILANQPGVYPPPAAIAWAKTKDWRQLRTSLLLCSAETLAAFGKAAPASVMLDEARNAIGRRTMGGGWIGAKLHYLTALVLFQQGKMADGEIALNAAMGYMQHGSFWRFHIAMADNLYTSGTASPRVAMELYSHVLRDPSSEDWTFNPAESLAVLLSPHPLTFEHWFEVAMQRREHETALEIADRARRHRYFSSMPLGGRLQSLRWILAGPTEDLDQQAQLNRRDLLAKFPIYNQLNDQARALEKQLDTLPLVADNPELLRKQQGMLEALAEVSMRQEVILREIALRREPAGMVFPPVRSTKDVMLAMPEGHALLAFFATSRHLYGFLLNKENYTYWRVGSPDMLYKKIVGLLREMGQYQQNYELGIDELDDEKWKKSSAEVLDLLLKGSQADFTQDFDELVIVPDGALWYLPFEALQVKVNGQMRPLISRFKMRYVPTTSLAVPSQRARRPSGNTAVVVGRLFPRDEDTVAQAAFEKIASAVPGAVALETPAPATSALYGTMFDRLVVLDDLDLNDAGPYTWCPVTHDRGKAGGTLAEWLSLPWGGPEEIVLPGFHTAAERSLKNINRATAGTEVFLSVCGLMSSGARTLLISRWRTGGETSFDLVREFIQELPNTTAADAWQRSVFLAAGSRLNLAGEPRVKSTATDAMPKAKHPFFWAGYMLVDSGTAPHANEPAESDEPVLKDPVLKDPVSKDPVPKPAAE